MTLFNAILLQAAPRSGYSGLIMVVGMVIVMYFFMIRPQQRKAKEQKKFSENLKKGDQVVTLGGLHGRIVSLDKDTVGLEVDKGVKLKFDRSAISFENSKIYKSTNSPAIEDKKEDKKTEATVQ
jgi:preprotein translocase subunit YajC